MDKYITIEEASQRTGKPIEELRGLMNEGKLRGVRADGTFKFKENDIAALQPAGEDSKEDTLMTIDADVLFAEGETDQPADAAAETWIAADMESVFDSEDFDVGDEPLGQARGSDSAMSARDLEPAPLVLSPEKDDTSLGAVLMEDDGDLDDQGDEPVISIDPESGIATITSPTPGVSRTHMIAVAEPEPHHMAFTPLLVVSLLALGFAALAMAAMLTGAGMELVEKVVENVGIFVGVLLGVAVIAAIAGFVFDRSKASREAAAARLSR